MLNAFAGRRHPQRLGLYLVLLLILVPFIPAQASPNDGDITITTTVTVEEITRASEILLAALTTQPGDAAPTGIGLRWAKDTAGWFPTWVLQLTSTTGVLPTNLPVRSPGNDPHVQLGQVTPVAGHTYEVTLSYSPSLGALAVKVYNATDGRTVFSDGFAVPQGGQQLYARGGVSVNQYMPVGASWASGSGEPGGPFLPLYQFEKRSEQGMIRLINPGPLPPGEYRIVLEHDGLETQIAAATPKARETYIPLPVAEIPLGRSMLRIDYVDDGQVLLTESRALTFGRVDFWMRPVTPERDEGVVRALFAVRSPEALSENIAVEVRANINELVWDEGRRQYNLVPYTQDQLVYQGPVDLSAGEADLIVDVPLPERPGNWRVRLTPQVLPLVGTTVNGQERQFSTHLPATVNPGDEYTIVVFPDTQYFSRSHPDIFTRMTDWVTTNAAEMNIAALLHVGDITDNNSPAQWENAYAAMSLLHDVVPYVYTIGNHDMVGPGGVNRRGDTLVNTYFPADRALRYSNLAGTMVPGRMENHYALLSIAGTDYVVISLEFGPPNEAMDWADMVAKQYPDHRLILLTHSYTARTGGLSRSPASYDIALNPETTVNTAVEMWEYILRRNPNSFMAISGHTSPDVPVVPHRVPRNAAGLPVYELLFDWQNQQPTGGNGWLGLLTFKPDGTVEVKVYSPYFGEYANDMDQNGYTSQLTIDTNTGIVRRVLNR